MSEWQPIETAPKEDGCEILGWDGNSVQVLEWWAGGGNPRLACWMDGHGISFEPTHWMPLPEPPLGAVA